MTGRLQDLLGIFPVSDSTSAVVDVVKILACEDFGPLLFPVVDHTVGAEALDQINVPLGASRYDIRATHVLSKLNAKGTCTCQRCEMVTCETMRVTGELERHRGQARETKTLAREGGESEGDKERERRERSQRERGAREMNGERRERER